MTDKWRLSPYHALAFSGSFLLFEIELLIAKILLPYFGGSAQVWTICMMFFQGALLAGYLYAHLGAGRLSVRGQALLHLAALTLAALSLPIRAEPALTASPATALLAALAASIGLPFIILSATVPVIQRWLSAAGRPESKDPYVLYAASNAGALAALLGYPFLIEPLLPLEAQVRLWQYCYALFAAGHLLCLPAAVPAAAGLFAARSAAPVAGRRLLSWLALSAGPCAAMLAAAHFLTLELAAVPLLWMAPLAAYLGTFILYFRRGGFRAGFLSRALAAAAGLAALAAAALAVGAGGPARDAAVGFLGFFLNMAALLVIAMICHGSLAADKPSDDGQASVYYLAISAGGCLAGVLMGVALPYLGRRAGWIGLDWMIAGALALAALVIRDWQRWRARRFFRPALLLGGCALLGAGLLGAHAAARTKGFTLRNFYGISSVEEKDGARVLLHGNTEHGLQYLDARRELEPTLYYHRQAPIGDIFRLFGPQLHDAGVLGLGAGTMAAYGRRGMTMTFYELDPDVADIARNRFTFLERSPAVISVVTGDGRLSLKSAGGARHDLIVLDAYNSGAIPVHLLTREAFELYLSRLAPGGLILCHISNRYLDLKPVLAALAQSLGLHAAVKAEAAPAAGGQVQRTQWAALSADAEKISRLESGAAWKDIAAYNSRWVRPWTDSYASLLPVIRFP
ncbi:MAG TPA: fused MFS/spermidine synthase [Elusimicrobiales bacterium]|mgnify:CR=1 FL=1|nr:fused MFS/spermidine synthase [Elusimicrobiales bacterium]